MFIALEYRLAEIVSFKLGKPLLSQYVLFAEKKSVMTLLLLLLQLLLKKILIAESLRKILYLNSAAQIPIFNLILLIRKRFKVHC